MMSCGVLRPVTQLTAFGRTTNILCLLTYLLTSAVELLNDARRSRMQDLHLDLLDMHTYCWDPFSSTKAWRRHSWYLVTGEAVEWRWTVETLPTGCVELFTATVVLSQPAPGSGTGWYCLTVIHCWCFGGLWKAACMGQRFCSAVVWIPELVRVKKLEIS